MNWAFLVFSLLIIFFVEILTGFFGAGGGFIITLVLNIVLGLEINLPRRAARCLYLFPDFFLQFSMQWTKI